MDTDNNNYGRDPNVGLATGGGKKVLFFSFVNKTQFCGFRRSFHVFNTIFDKNVYFH